MVERSDTGEEMTDDVKRLEGEMAQLKTRTDDISYRLAVVETQQKGVESKLDMIKTSIDEKLTAMAKSIEKQSGNISWAIKIFLGSVIAGFATFIMSGGFSGV